MGPVTGPWGIGPSNARLASPALRYERSVHRE